MNDITKIPFPRKIARSHQFLQFFSMIPQNDSSGFPKTNEDVRKQACAHNREIKRHIHQQYRTHRAQARGRNQFFMRLFSIYLFASSGERIYRKGLMNPLPTLFQELYLGHNHALFTITFITNIAFAVVLESLVILFFFS